MKGTIIVLGATLIAAVIASTESPSPDSPTKVEADAKRSLRPYPDPPANDDKLAERSYTALELTNFAPPAITPIATAVPERISEK